MFTKTKMFLLTALLASVALMASLIVYSGINQSAPISGPYGAKEYKRNVQSALASCGGIFLTNPIDNKFWGTIPPKYQDFALDRIPTQFVQIPTYGFMVNKPTDPSLIKVYDKKDTIPEIPTINRLLYDGYNIIWYDPFLAPNNDVAELKKFAAELNKNKPTTAVMPFVLKDRAIPFAKSFAFSTWGASQSCQSFNIDTYKQFVQFSEENGVDHSGKPQEAPLSYEGLFYAPHPETAK